MDHWGHRPDTELDHDLSRRTLLRSVGAVTAGAVVAGLGTDQLSTFTATGRERLRARATNDRGDPVATRVLWRGATTERLAALTFDDGPSQTYTPALLDVLAEEGVHATFCLVGRRAAAEPALVRRQAEAGHELVNHSYSHADLSAVDRTRVLAELRRTDDVIAELTGQAPALVRPPYGRLSGTVLAIAAELGHDVLLWDNQVEERHTTVAANVRHVLGGLRPGMVLLAHDAGPALRRIGMASVRPVIRAAKAQGYRFVTASELHAVAAQ